MKPETSVESARSRKGVRPAGVPRLGAWLEAGGARFRVWAPTHGRVELVLDPGGAKERSVALEEERPGFFGAFVPGLGAGARYQLRVDGQGPFPDPWSRAQPDGVHGPSALVDPSSFAWTDGAWRGLARDELVLYELHVGAATPEGTFEALLPRLPELRALGVTALELMPVASFPGRRGWGYDGVFPFAPQAGYGGAKGLQALVDAAHAHGLGVVLDVVYNHFGPDGNYLRAFSPHYFTGRHPTPWGEGINYDGEGSEVVRELVLSNAEMWIREFHLDGLRLDAAHAIVDDGRPHLLEALVTRARAAAEGRSIVLIAEDDRNERRLVLPQAEGGVGLDAVWADDLHHQLRRAFAGDHQGYYADYTGEAADIARTLERGWFYEGQRSPQQDRARGTPAGDLPPQAFVHCIQNHDQIGNRPQGDRLGESVSFAAYRALSALLLVSPYTPLLFMGQEWNARSPFLYFTDHHPELGRLVTEGRRREFQGFSGFQGKEVPDPQAPETFTRSALDWAERAREGHAGVWALYRELLALRRTSPALRARERESFRVQALSPDLLALERGVGTPERLVLLVNLRGETTLTPEADLWLPGARVLLSTEEPRFGGPADGEARQMPGGGLVLRGPVALLLGAPAGD